MSTQEEGTGVLIVERQLPDHLVRLDRELHEVGNARGTRDITLHLGSIP
jgi:hypothetical protein